MRETECSHYEPADGDCLTNACGGCCVKYRAELEALRAENERLRAAATEALAVLTRLADSGLPVPCGAEIDSLKGILMKSMKRTAELENVILWHLQECKSSISAIAEFKKRANVGKR